MDHIGDLMILNVLFIVCSIPIITMGASITALYGVFLKKLREKDISVFKEFLNGFKIHFKKSTIVWLIILLAGGILVFDTWYLINSGKNAFWNMIGIIVGGIIVFWKMIYCYVFPLISQSKYNIKEVFVNSIYMAIKYFPYTVIMVLFNSIPFICFILGDYFSAMIAPIYISIGFSVIAFINALLLRKIFKVYNCK